MIAEMRCRLWEGDGVYFKCDPKPNSEHCRICDNEPRDTAALYRTLELDATKPNYLCLGCYSKMRQVRDLNYTSSTYILGSLGITRESVSPYEYQKLIDVVYEQLSDIHLRNTEKINPSCFAFLGKDATDPLYWYAYDSSNFSYCAHCQIYRLERRIMRTPQWEAVMIAMKQKVGRTLWEAVMIDMKQKVGRTLVDEAYDQVDGKLKQEDEDMAKETSIRVGNNGELVKVTSAELSKIETAMVKVGEFVEKHDHEIRMAQLGFSGMNTLLSLIRLAKKK